MAGCAGKAGVCPAALQRAWRLRLPNPAHRGYDAPPAIRRRSARRSASGSGHRRAGPHDPGNLRRAGEAPGASRHPPGGGAIHPLLRQEPAAKHRQLGRGARGAGSDPRRGCIGHRQNSAIRRRAAGAGMERDRRPRRAMVHPHLPRPGQQVRLFRHRAAGNRSFSGQLQEPGGRHARLSPKAERRDRARNSRHRGAALRPGIRAGRLRRPCAGAARRRLPADPPAGRGRPHAGPGAAGAGAGIPVHRHLGRALRQLPPQNVRLLRQLAGGNLRGSRHPARAASPGQGQDAGRRGRHRRRHRRHLRERQPLCGCHRPGRHRRRRGPHQERREQAQRGGHAGRSAARAGGRRGGGDRPAQH